MTRPRLCTLDRTTNLTTITYCLANTLTGDLTSAQHLDSLLGPHAVFSDAMTQLTNGAAHSSTGRGG